MGAFDNPFDEKKTFWGGCSCGGHHSQDEHDRAVPATPEGTEELTARVAENAILYGLFGGNDLARRNFLKAVGASAAMAAIGQIFPLDAAKAAAADYKGTLEKTDLKIGFVPINCATPIIMAEPMGFYKKHGLNVQVMKTAGWAVIRDKTLAGEYDAAHMLSPMPLALSLGLGSPAVPYTIPAIENVNGQAITMAMKHKDNRDPKNWKGMTFGIPFDYSMHNFLLRYYLAEHGLNPDVDVKLRVLPPPELVANLSAGNIDGFLGPEPFNQRAVYDGVGYLHLLTKTLWDKHPCCSFAASRSFLESAPNTFHALVRSIIEATAYASKMENRKEIVKAIAPKNYLNQPEAVLEQAMIGPFADGLGNIVNMPDRMDFDPFPWHSMAVWMLTQMKRWGYLKGDVDYRQVAEKVFLATDAQVLMTEAGLTPPKETYKTFSVMGKPFDPAKPEDYLASFAIRKV